MADTTAEQTLTLENISGRIAVFNLTLGHGATRHLFKRANEKGEQRVVLPPTFTLLAREKREGLAPGLLSAPEIKAAVAAKRLRATIVEPPKGAEPMKAEPLATVSDRSDTPTEAPASADTPAPTDDAPTPAPTAPTPTPRTSRRAIGT